MFKIRTTGIHIIRSRPVVADYYNLAPTIKITPKVVLWTSEVLLNHRIFSKNLMWFYRVHFTCVLTTSQQLLKAFRITEINMQLGTEWNRKWWCSIFHKRIADPVFMLLTISIFFHFVKNCIDGPFAENVTALIKMWRFLESILPPSAEKT